MENSTVTAGYFTASQSYVYQANVPSVGSERSHYIRPVVYLEPDVRLSYDADTHTYTIIDDTREVDKNGVALAQGIYTTPYLPDNNSEITSNNLKKGLTVKDGNGNEWVWIEVPRTSEVYATAGLSISTFDDSAYQAIRTDLENYAKTLIPEGNNGKNAKNGGKDYWYYMTQTGTVYSIDPLNEEAIYKNDAATPDNVSSYIISTDETKGTGLTYEQYQTKYKAMLKSIYINGGFYIGKYETGTKTPRSAAGNELKTPEIKENLYPYNYINASQAESLAEELAPAGKNTSVMFGVQWDLILKHIEQKAIENGIAIATIQNYIKEDSRSWGNYYASSFEINRGKYSTASPWSTFKNYTEATTGKVTITEGVSTKTANQIVLCTTGAAESSCKYNIYDLAGNLFERTLEKTYNTTYPSSYRGAGCYNLSNDNYQVSRRNNGSPGAGVYYIGFRCTMY